VDSYVAMIVSLLDLASFNMKPYPKVKQWIERIKKQNGDSWEDVCEMHNLQVIQRGMNYIKTRPENHFNYGTSISAFQYQTIDMLS
jgi:hypothetical protein